PEAAGDGAAARLLALVPELRCLPRGAARAQRGDGQARGVLCLVDRGRAGQGPPLARRCHMAPPPPASALARPRTWSVRLPRPSTVAARATCRCRMTQAMAPSAALPAGSTATS